MGSFDGKRLNSTNDVVVKSDSSVWFTDPIFGLLGNYEGYKAEPEIDMNVYRIDSVTGKSTIVATGVLGPNGLCFSPDEKILYIIESRGVPTRKILAYDVAPGGDEITNKRGFVDAGPGTPAGMRAGGCRAGPRRAPRALPPPGRRRPAAPPGVQGREPVDLRAVCEHPRRAG